MTAVARDSYGSSFSGAGGLDRLFRALRVVRNGPGDVLRQWLVFLAATWLPFAGIQLIEWLAFRRVEPLFYDISLHVRFLIAVPLLFFAESTLRRRCSTAMELLSERAGDGTVRRLALLGQRLRSTPFDVLLLMLAFFSARLAPHGFEGASSGPASDWYRAIALPLATFLILRVVWSWLVWCLLLAMFAQLDLHPNPLHPDRSGGLRFLSLPSNGFTPVLTAVSSVVAAAWETQILLGTRRFSLESAAVPFAIFLVCSLAVTIGPLLPFMPQLYRARLDGLRRYGCLGDAYSSLFEQRWLRGRASGSVLGSPDIQSLADLASGNDLIEKMRIVPFGTTTVVGVTLSLAIPLIPLAMLQVPFHEAVRKMLGMILGGRG